MSIDTPNLKQTKTGCQKTLRYFTTIQQLDSIMILHQQAPELLIGYLKGYTKISLKKIITIPLTYILFRLLVPHHTQYSKGSPQGGPFCFQPTPQNPPQLA